MTAPECTDRGGRGCPCPWHAKQKIRAREYARAARARRLEEKRRTGNKCPRQRGTGVCGGRLETEIVNGRTTIVCRICERMARGICADCPRPVEGAIGKAFRCAHHKELAKKQQMYDCGRRLAAQNRVKSREYYQKNPDVRARRNAYKRLYRKANPERVREYKRQYTMKHGSDDRSRYLDYHRRYNAQVKRQEKKRADALAKYYELHPTRPKLKCKVCDVAIAWMPGHGRPRQTCDQHCGKAELARRIKVAARANPPAPTAPAAVVHKPIRVRRPMPPRYAETGERLCFTPGCDTVLTHRKKKCGKCREREQQQAIAQLKAAGLLTGKPRRAKAVKITPLVDRARPTRLFPASRDAAAWRQRLATGMTTWQMAEELGITHGAVLDQLRIAGPDLIGQANQNNVAAEKASRTIAATMTWARPRAEAAAS